ncbi:MAG: lysophospholipid acyltransferase family protein [Kiritimatiellae bacterium]|nr:lysophospholipid acyltransferase family protein [Kiritimatiellia bacterium]
MIATRAACATIPRLSRSAVLAAARAFAKAAAATPSHARKVALANLQLAYGEELSAAARRQRMRRSFESFALALLDAVWFGGGAPQRLRDHVRHDRAFLERIRADRPHVLLTAHLGDWEALGQAVAAEGVRLMSVAAPLANPSVDRLFAELRRASGQTIVPQRGAMLRLWRHLKDGGQVAMLLDQNVKPEEGGVFVPFFGLPVPVSRAAAALALRMRCPILSAFMLAESDGTCRVIAGEAIEPSAFPSGEDAEAVAQLTAEVAALCERAVRRWPDAWLWSYKRWKHVPPGAPAERYPFYAKPWRPAAVDRAEATPAVAAPPVGGPAK